MRTQGTWKAYHYQAAGMDKPVYDIGTGDGVIICRRVENEADARLIEMAPELLEICKNINGWPRQGGFREMSSEVFKQIDKVIKKVEE